MMKFCKINAQSMPRLMAAAALMGGRRWRGTTASSRPAARPATSSRPGTSRRRSWPACPPRAPPRRPAAAARTAVVATGTGGGSDGAGSARPRVVCQQRISSSHLRSRHCYLLCCFSRRDRARAGTWLSEFISWSSGSSASEHNRFGCDVRGRGIAPCEAEHMLPMLRYPPHSTML